jgi:hypothetical protein
MLARVSQSVVDLIRRHPPLVHSGGSRYWGLAFPALRWLEENVQPGMVTLETGSGASTVVFAAGGARHTAISPDPEEHEGIKRYCAEHRIDTGAVTFFAGSSHEVLPGAWRPEPLDVVLLDGAHGFPYPVLDWWFTERHLKVGGRVLLDDAYLASVNVVARYLRHSPSWELETVAGQRTPCFRKLDDAEPTFEWGILDRHPSHDYLPPQRRAVAWARYRLIDWGPLRPLARRVALVRGRRAGG